MMSDWFAINSGVRQGCRIAPNLNYVDDIALLAKLLEVLILCLEILYEEECQFGLESN